MMKILIADDSATNRAGLSRLVEKLVQSCGFLLSQGQ
jgi:CheY-like chemotaxis protein